MNIFLWILQIILALHTVIGALWKFSNSEATVPSLAAMPHSVWVGASLFEFLCAFALVLPLLNSSLAILAPLGALGIALEMLAFCGLHLYSGAPVDGQVVYWVIVAAICVFIAYGRLALKPL